MVHDSIKKKLMETRLYLLFLSDIGLISESASKTRERSEPLSRKTIETDY
jgi:hypothetical protein